MPGVAIGEQSKLPHETFRMKPKGLGVLPVTDEHNRFAGEAIAYTERQRMSTARETLEFDEREIICLGAVAYSSDYSQRSLVFEVVRPFRDQFSLTAKREEDFDLFRGTYDMKASNQQPVRFVHEPACADAFATADPCRGVHRAVEKCGLFAPCDRGGE